MDKVVCEICGSGSKRCLIAKCVECSSYQHRYCMPVVTFSIQSEWLCYECQQKADGYPRPNQGGQNELQMLNGKETSKLDPGHSNAVHKIISPYPGHSNVVHQIISPYTRGKFSNAKVKFISSEEVASLNRDRRPYGRSNSAMWQSQVHSMSPSLKQQSNMKCTSPTRSGTQKLALSQFTSARHDQEKIEKRSDVDMRKNQVRSASPPNLNKLSNMKCMSPSRSDTEVHAPLKHSIPASHDKSNIENRSEFATQKCHVPHASPPNVKQSSNSNCISPSRSDTQVHVLKRCAAASHEARMSTNREVQHGSSMPMANKCRTQVAVKRKLDSQVDEKTKEKKIVSADKGKESSQVQHELMEEALSVSDATGCESEVKSPSHNIDVQLIINLSEPYSRRPSDTNCWAGCFLVNEAGTRHNLGEFKAYLPSTVSRKAYDIANMMPSILQLDMLPRMNDWPKTFETIRPIHQDIGLFFISKNFDGRERKHSDLLETSCNYVMRAYINNIKLLIYSSEVLPPDSQWIDGESYLWGVFVRRKGHLTSTST